MNTATSKQLHPHNGARFVFCRTQEKPLRYGVVVYVHDGRTIDGELSWPERKAELEAELPEGPLRDEVLKLARSLRAKAPARMTRWRPLS